MDRNGLFVDDLLETLGHVRDAPAAESAPDVTTQALGEEGDQPDDPVITTQALGEEGDQDDVEVTSQALGEEGDQADDQSTGSGWGYSDAEDDLYLDEPAEGDDDVPFDTAL